MAIPVGNISTSAGRTQRAEFKRQILRPLFASTYIRRIYRADAGVETDLSRGYENGEVLAFGDGGTDFRSLDDVSLDSFEIDDWASIFWDTWDTARARLWLITVMEPRLRQSLIFLNNVYGPLDRFDAELGRGWGHDTMVWLGLVPRPSRDEGPESNLFDIGGRADVRISNAQRAIKTLLVFDDGYGCLSTEQRQDPLLYAYPTRMPVKFTDAYFSTRFVALDYWRETPSGLRHVPILNLPDVEDGGGLLSEDPRHFLAWAENAWPQEEEISISSGAGSTTDIRPAARAVQCPVLPDPESAFGDRDIPVIVEAPLPCPDIDNDPPSREDICTIDASAQIPEWTDQMEPFLNSRVCEYYIPIQTTYQCVGADEYAERAREYSREAIQRMLDFLNKQASAMQRQILKEFIQNENYYEFDKAPNVDVKLLYRWPFGLVKALRLQDRTEPAGTSDLAGPNVEISTSNILVNLDTLKLILENLSPQQVNMWSSEREKILLNGTAQEANILGESQNIISFRTDMLKFLDSNNYILPPIEIPSEGIIADSLQIYYDSDYKLSVVQARELGGDYKRLNMGNLPSNNFFRNPTMISYLVNLDNIITQYNNSQELSVTSFLQQYHYPAVRIANQASLGDPPLLPTNCSGGVLEDVANSVVDALVDSAKEFASTFADNLCMTEDQAARRDAQIESSIDDLKGILSEQNMKNIVMQDPLISNISSTINGINQSTDTVTAAWSNLFDKLTACGLFTLASKTMETIAKNDVCGLSPEAVLMIAIKASLKKTSGRALRDIFNGLPAEFKVEIQELYSQRFREYANQVGYSGPSGFPWDLEEQNRQLERDRSQGRVLYDGSLFTAPSLEQTESRYQNSYRAGYQANVEFDASLFNSLSEGAYDEGSFWSGYVQARVDVGAGTTQVPGEVVAPPRVSVLTDAQRLQANSPSVNSSAFGQLAGGLAADTIKFGFDVFIEVMSDTLGIDQLIEQVQDVPVLAGIIKIASEVTKCAVDVKFTSDQEGGSPVNLSSIQANLQNGLKGDICEVIGGLKALTLPDIEATMNTALNTETLKSAFVNALIKTLKNLLVKVLINTLVQLIRKTTQVLQGALCEATKSNISAAIEGSIAGNAATQVYTPPGNIANLFADAFCGPPDGSSGLDDQVSRLVSSMSGAPVGALTSGSGTCSLIDSLSRRLRMDQLLDLMQGTPSENVIQIVLSVSRNECPEFSDFLSDEASVRSFFQNLSTAFPQEFLDDTRNSLEAFGGDRQDIITTCNIEPDLSGLEKALRDECGDNISDDQIQKQMESFRSRIEDTIADLASAMTGGFSESMTDTIQTAMSNIVPKDDPTNVALVKQIVDSMFDSFFTTYATGLLGPLAPNGNGGYMNLVLSNKNSTPIIGQHVQLGASMAVLTGPLLALLPPPLSTVAAADLMENLRFSYFGNEPRGGAPQLKPNTVAQYLRNLFSSGEYVSLSSEGGVLDETVTLSYEGTLTFPLFDIAYNFDTSQGVLQRYGIFGEPSTSEGSILELSSLESGAIYGQIESYLNNTEHGTSPNDIYDSFFGSIERAPLPVGASALLYNLFITDVVDDFFDPETWSESGASLTDLSNGAATLLRILRQGAFRTLGSSVSYNENAFSYGTYNLDTITDSDVTPAVNPELLEQGYEVFYLDDGNIVVIPPRKGGWLELKDILLPKQQESYCCPDKKELLDIPSIKEAVLKAFESSDEDERLYQNPRTVREAPYAHIGGRTTTACLEGVVKTTLRIYIIENILNGYASFSKYKTDFPLVYSDLFADYIAKKIKAGLRMQGPNPAGPPFPPGSDAGLAAMAAQIAASLGLPPDALAAGAEASEAPPRGFYGYWHDFLEHCVQTYLSRAEAGTLTVTESADRALRAISDFSRDYEYPQREELKEIRRTRPFMTLKKLRREKNILAVQATENQATIVLKELIKEEFNRISQDIAQIFPTPEGGWIESTAVDFLRNAYYVGSRNIFDIPRIRSDILNGERGDLNFESGGHFILQSYVRPVLNQVSARYSSLRENIESDRIYGLAEIKQQMELSGLIDDGLGMGGETIRDHFTSFKYGLRLIYAPGNQTITDIGGSDSALIQLLNREDAASRLYSHPAQRFSIPIVSSRNIEVEYEGSMPTFYRSTTTITLGQQNIYNANHFNWPLLTQLMLNSQEFKIIFNYAVPLTSIQSLNTMFNIESFLDSVGRQDEWIIPNIQLPAPEIIPIPLPPATYMTWSRKMFPAMKRRLKRIFNLLYRANDFSYSPPGNEDAEETVEALSERSNADSWSDKVTPQTRTRIIFEDPTCFSGDSSSSSSTGGTSGGSPSSGPTRTAIDPETGLPIGDSGSKDD